MYSRQSRGREVEDTEENEGKEWKVKCPYT